MPYKEFQIADYARLAIQNGAVLAHDTGLGKTWSAFTWPLLKLGWTTAHPPSGPALTPQGTVLIVAPGDLHLQFAETAHRFGVTLTQLDSQSTFHHLATGGIIGRTLPPGFYITSYTQLGLNGVEVLPDTTPAAYTAGLGEVHHQCRCIAYPTLSDLVAHSFDCVVVDEAVRIKSGEAKIAQAIHQLAPRYRLVLTATPIKNRVPDIFRLAWWACGGQAHAHARFPYRPDDALTFAKTFCLSERNLTKEAAAQAQGQKRRYLKLTPQVCNVHRLWKLMAPIVLRRRKRDIGEHLVSKTRRVIRVPMGDEQARVYRAHLEWKPKDKNGKATMGPVLQALRLAATAPHSPLLTQARGPCYVPKLATALSIIAEILERHEQFIVFCPFHDPLDALAQRLLTAGVAHAVLDGRTSQTRRGVLAAQFKRPMSADRPLPGLLAGSECMAEGHSFPLCNNVISLSYPWALDKVIQAEDRAWRLDSVRPLNVYRLVTERSIDRKMESLIDEKSDAAELVLDGHLLGENPEELNLAELLGIAASEFDTDTRTLSEMRMEDEWPEVCDRLTTAAQAWRYQLPDPAPAHPRSSKLIEPNRIAPTRPLDLPSPDEPPDWETYFTHL